MHSVILEELRNYTATRIESRMMKLTVSYPRISDSTIKMRFGVYLATYSQPFNGKLYYYLSVDGNKVCHGEWKHIEDNSIMYVDFDGGKGGTLSLDLVCASGRVGVWKTQQSTGALLAVEGKHIGRGCFRVEYKRE